MNQRSENPIAHILVSLGSMLIRLGSNAKPDEQPDLDSALLERFQPNGITSDAQRPDSKDDADSVIERRSEKDREEQARWVARLADLASQFDVELGVAFGKRGEYVHVIKASDATGGMLQQLYSDFNELATAFNTVLSKTTTRRVRVTVSDFFRQGQSKEARSHGNSYSHFKISTVSRQLLVAGQAGKIHFYLVPATMAANQGVELDERRKLSMRLSALPTGLVWTVYGLPVQSKDIAYYEKALLRDLIILSAMDAVALESGNKFEHVDNLARFSDERGFRDTISLASEPSEDLVRDLLLAQQNTVHKLLNQQEETQASISRDLHDGVLADILMLQRKLSSDSAVDREEIGNVLDTLTTSIRDICSGLVPRDLKDWGLEIVLQDLMDKVAEQTEADCSVDVEGTIPELPSQVQLHIFRIVQECLNNVKKYANAKTIVLTIKSSSKLLSFKIQDDGDGFEMPSEKERTDGGLGLHGIQERIEIIKAFYPTRFNIESKRGAGTSVLLELVFQAQDF